ncbi:unnamed protein product [Dicrocoelium dendriticum]|nr:unnamed protein product [Dicrocoelium dendriticum]
MIAKTISTLVDRCSHILQQFTEWDKQITSFAMDENASFCCDLMEQTASLQHELFKLLHHFVRGGGMNIQRQQLSDNSKSESAIRGRPSTRRKTASESPQRSVTQSRVPADGGSRADISQQHRICSKLSAYVQSHDSSTDEILES